jgi:TolB-like protein
MMEGRKEPTTVGFSATPMGRTLDDLGHFLGELQRRRVGRVAIAYAAVAFVLLQLGEIVFPVFGAPDWALRVLVIASFLGFPPALVLAWVFDVTSEGISRTRELPGDDASTEGTDVEASCPPVAPNRVFPRLALLGVTGITFVVLGWWTVRDSLGQEAVAQDGGAAPALGLSDSVDASGIPEVRSLAILPLDDFSQEEGGEHFTAAMHEELVNQLSLLGGIRVLSRTSVLQLDRTGKTLPVIADELGVDAVVEGSVFRAGDRVRISVQLIHGPSDRHLWAGSYEGTLEDAIALQGEVAEAIAREIQAEVFPEEGPLQGRVKVAVNPEAQESFLKGRLEQSRATPEALRAAEGHYRQAVEKDSTFAPAYAGLAAARFLMSLEEGEAPQGDRGKASTTVAPLDPGVSVVRSPPSVDAGVLEPLRMAFSLDRQSPEAMAVLLALRQRIDTAVAMALPEEIRIRMASEGSLESELVLTGTEFGRQLQRLMVDRGVGPGTGRAAEGRLAGVQRLQAAGDWTRAAFVLRELVTEPEAPPQAWDALEQILTLQGDFAGALEVRRERVARTDPSPQALASVQRLELLLEKEGERGYWLWRLGEMEARRAKGEAVSRVESARAHLALGRREEALAELRKALEHRDRALLSLWSDPAWDPLRADPAFLDIQAKIRRGEPGSATSGPGGSPPPSAPGRPGGFAPGQAP